MKNGCYYVNIIEIRTGIMRGTNGIIERRSCLCL
jgi:hypothetical protein